VGGGRGAVLKKVPGRPRRKLLWGLAGDGKRAATDGDLGLPGGSGNPSKKKTSRSQGYRGVWGKKRVTPPYQGIQFIQRGGGAMPRKMRNGGGGRDQKGRGGVVYRGKVNGKKLGGMELRSKRE